MKSRLIKLKKHWSLVVGRVLTWLINHVADENQRIAEYVANNQ
ncbi:hypothetical protein [Halanaerobaculum tunisiense]